MTSVRTLIRAVRWRLSEGKRLRARVAVLEASVATLLDIVRSLLTTTTGLTRHFAEDREALERIERVLSGEGGDDTVDAARRRSMN